MLLTMMNECKIREMLGLDLHGYHLYNYLHYHGIEVLKHTSNVCLRFS